MGGAELRHIGARWGTAPRWARALLELIPVRRDPPCNVVDTPDAPARSRVRSSTAASTAARTAKGPASSIATADTQAAHRGRKVPYRDYRGTAPQKRRPPARDRCSERRAS